jgi:hypothetical protein
MARFISLGLVGGCNFALVSWLKNPGDVSIDSLVESMVEMYLAVGRSVTEFGLARFQGPNVIPPDVWAEKSVKIPRRAPSGNYAE